MIVLIDKKYIYSNNIGEFSKTLKDYISDVPRNRKMICVCIGTDKATGDCLGPLVGSILERLNMPDIFGTLKNPVHALNLENTVRDIYSYYKNPYILAVDASLGKTNHIGAINVWKGSLSPGSGIAKKLIDVGDISVTGIVNSYSTNGYYQLQSTRLSIVMDMAYVIGKGIYQALN